jgi:hypothetical protein
MEPSASPRDSKGWIRAAAPHWCCNFAARAERHRPIAIPGAAARTIAHHHRIDVPLETVPHTEKIAHRGIDAWRRAAVVIDAEPQQPWPAVLIGGHRQPHVSHDSGTLKVTEDDRLARNRTPRIVITLRVRVVAGSAVGAVILQPEQRERVECLGAAHGRKHREKNE